LITNSQDKLEKKYDSIISEQNSKIEVLQEEVENTRQQLLDLKKEQNESKKKKKISFPLVYWLDISLPLLLKFSLVPNRRLPG